jgi:hypothetical protein
VWRPLMLRQSRRLRVCLLRRPRLLCRREDLASRSLCRREDQEPRPSPLCLR